ncbi:hypothetical protein BS47DRAFT_601052 [Hydnum rufescens UP504]|uniref:Uncharacterized protein n=1 Tax=Hydnum rufescens UP504 TaxID=1448309 RepID=A0A9P6AH96_9AGAM|nr:hypothetical protein BS47DRAFT_601052 [Hydnum rufescens UP504]
MHWQCQFWDPDNYDDEDDHGFTYDVSPDAHWSGGIGGQFVKPRGVGESAFVSFDITLKPDLKSFEGTFSNDNELTKYNWTGTTFEIPKELRKVIEDRVKNRPSVAPPNAEKAFYKAQESATPSYAVDVYLPASRPDAPPPYASVAGYSSGAPEGMSELKLWQISSYKVVKDPVSGVLYPKDVVQEYVGKASHNIFMTSLAGSVKEKFHFSDAGFPLQDGEKTIKQNHAKFNNAASLPYFAQALHQSAVTTDKQKKEIDADKLEHGSRQ